MGRNWVFANLLIKFDFLAHLNGNIGGSAGNPSASGSVGNEASPNQQSVFNISSPFAQHSLSKSPTSLHSVCSVPSNGNSTDYSIHGLFNESNNMHRTSSNSSSTFYDSNKSHVSHFNNPENVFNTSFMKTVVGYFAESNAREFSINEYLSPIAIESVAKNCDCCLCKLSIEHSIEHEFCIKKNPYGDHCTNELDSNVQTVCDNCMDAMVYTSKKTEIKRFKCGIIGCSAQLKTVCSIRSHFLNHFHIKNFVCCLCEKGYCTRMSLCNHQRNHLQDTHNSLNEWFFFLAICCLFNEYLF